MSAAPAGRPTTRAAILLATAAAAAVGACGKEATTTSPGTADAGMMIAAPYGVPLPPPDAGGPPVPDQGQMTAPAYGVPPPNLVPTPTTTDAGLKKK